MTDGLDPEFLAVARRAQDLVDRAYGPVGGGRRDDGLSRDAQAALVELAAEDVRDGSRRPEPYLALPAHLPQDPVQLRALHDSTLARDRMFSADILEWAQINRRVLASRVAALRVLPIATRKADYLLADPEVVDEVKARVWAWRKEILAYTVATFRVDPARAPEGRAELDAWCEARMAKGDPTPDWLLGSTSDRRGRRVESDDQRVDGRRGEADGED